MKIGRTFFQNDKPVDKLEASGTIIYLRNLFIGGSDKWIMATTSDTINITQNTTYSAKITVDNSENEYSSAIRVIVYNKSGQKLVDNVGLEVPGGTIGDSTIQFFTPYGATSAKIYCGKFEEEATSSSKFQYPMLVKGTKGYFDNNTFTYSPEDILK